MKVEGERLEVTSIRNSEADLQTAWSLRIRLSEINDSDWAGRLNNGAKSSSLTVHEMWFVNIREFGNTTASQVDLVRRHTAMSNRLELSNNRPQRGTPTTTNGRRDGDVQVSVIDAPLKVSLPDFKALTIDIYRAFTETKMTT